jgi:hypothetical protein
MVSACFFVHAVHGSLNEISFIYRWLKHVLISVIYDCLLVSLVVQVISYISKTILMFFYGNICFNIVSFKIVTDVTKFIMVL